MLAAGVPKGGGRYQPGKLIGIGFILAACL